MAENYTIVAQNHVRDFTVGNRAIDAVEIDFVTPEGDSGRVRIPVERYTAEHVNQEVDARAQELRAVRNL